MGKNGGPSNCTGKSGEDLRVRVPPGTIIRDDGTGFIIADLIDPGQEVVLVRGGKGGKGNQHFATATRQVPSFAKNGEPGEEKQIALELKVLADVGLIGFPNVGKSTILSIVSAALPKIADYHFTTLSPNLGVVRLDDENSFVLADIPGLIEGAHTGAGLGHKFLKHVERTRVLIHVVDISGIEGRDPFEDFKIINDELREYNPVLSERPQVVAANKIDLLPDAGGKITEFAKAVEPLGYKVFPVSAASNKGVRELMYHVAEMLKSIPYPDIVDVKEQEVVYTPKEEDPFTVYKDDDGAFVVEGNWINKIMGSINIDSYESLQYFQRAIKRIGIIDALENMGINEGDTVKINDFEFEYIK